ncbi:BTB And Kelch, partial [Cooperia oncophora]
MYIVQNFQKVAESEGFNQLRFDRLIKLISSEELNVQSEEQLLEHVRLASCHPKFLVETVSQDPLVMTDATCRHLLDKTKNSQLLRLSTYGPLELQGRKSRKSFETGEVLY